MSYKSINNHSMRQTAFVGREREIQQLSALAEEAVQGRGETIFIAGKAGMGKTRLVQEFADSLDAQGFKVLRGLCLPDNYVPLLPIKEALRSGGLYHISTGGNPRAYSSYTS